MLPRHLAPTLLRLARGFPVLAVTGPRQSGKTTLVRSLFPDKSYVSLEDPAERAFAEEDPKGFLARFDQGAVFDEAQRWPALFSWLQGMVDANRQPGRFVLTGSQQFGLLAGVTQSLAGRVAMTRLLPLTLGELPAKRLADVSLDSLLYCGGYPVLHTEEVRPADWLASYVASYIERDVRQVINVRDLTSFQRFVRLCAGRTGQLLNLSSLAGEAGISQGTAKAWLSVLEASDLVFLLPPYHRNFGKRLVKSPKLYFVDVGLACWLLGLREPQTLALHPLRGALFETLVVSEFLKIRYNQGETAGLYFWRDNNGLEADLLLEKEGGLQPVEIKSGATVTSDYLRAARRAGGLTDQGILPPWLIYGGQGDFIRNDIRVLGWQELARL